MITVNDLKYSLPKSFRHFFRSRGNSTHRPSNFTSEESIEFQDALKNMCPEPPEEVKAMGVTRNDLVFIDGKSVSELIGNKVPQSNEALRNTMGENMIAAALVSGKSRVSSLSVSKTVNGRFSYTQNNIKPHLIGMGDTAKDEHSYIRRTLFNRGPFKLVPRATQVQNLNLTKTSPEMWEELNKKIANTVERIDNYKAAPQTHDNTKVAADPVKGVDIVPDTFTSLNFEGNKDLILRVAKETYAESSQMNLALEETLRDVTGRPILSFDPREMQNLSLLIPQGPDHLQKTKEMCQDFISDDPVRKKPWLDMMYDLRDSTDLFSMDLSNPADVRKATIAFQLEQAMAGFADSNQEYYAARYPTQKQLTKTKNLDDIQLSYGFMVGILAKQEGIESQDEIGNYPPHPYSSEWAKQNLQNNIYNYRVEALGEKFEAISLLASPEFKIFLGKSIDDIKPAQGMTSEEEDAVTNTINATFKTLNTAGMPGYTRDDLVFIDGKSVNEIVDEKNMTLNAKERNSLGERIIAAALVNGKNRVHTMSLTKDENGEISSHLQEVKPDLTKLGETNSYEYSSARIKLLNWGPTKCVTPAERLEKLYSKPMPEEAYYRLCYGAQLPINAKVQEYNEQLPQNAANPHRVATNVKAISATLPLPNFKMTMKTLSKSNEKEEAKQLKLHEEEKDAKAQRSL
ncbi:MAG: hypothetical protein RSE25_10415 [Bacteroidales bacterium]